MIDVGRSAPAVRLGGSLAALWARRCWRIAERPAYASAPSALLDDDRRGRPVRLRLLHRALRVVPELRSVRPAGTGTGAGLEVEPPAQ